ncbi:MAG TPA: hypothetical protein GX738_07995 [Firmicutes bacterium]|nr:hypothetical protein [Bacillota bacterium]
MWKGSTISRFPLRIIGTLPQGGTAGNYLFLARAYGATIRRLGGVPYGASGSPVYRGRTLLGAISTVFTPDNSLVGITPIAAMLALTQEPTQSTPPAGSSHPVTRLPITAQGLSSYRALNALEQHYGRVQDVVNIGIAPTEQQGRQLRAGESIGTALMLGDIQMGYIGTATLVQGSQVFAFGHPLLFAGPTNIPLTQAPIVTTTRGEFPQKIGSFGAVIGAIHQDRSAGVLAELGSVPLTVHMQFTVQDTDRQRTTTVTTQAANIKSELPFLTFIGVLESMQRAMNRVGSGSATWQWRLTLTNTSEPIQATASEEDATDIGFLVAISGESLVSQALATGVNLKSIELTAVVSSQPISE